MTNKATKERENTALVLLKSRQLICKDTGIKILDREPIEEEKEEEEPDFLELNEATQKATKEVQLDDDPPILLEANEDEYQFEEWAQ